MKNIKIICLISAVFLFTTGVFAQDEIIKKHPVKKQDLGVKEFIIDGMKVIYKPSTKDIISASLFVKGGTSNYPKDQEGIEKLAMSVLAESGSQKYPHDTYHSLLLSTLQEYSIHLYYPALKNTYQERAFLSRHTFLI